VIPKSAAEVRVELRRTVVTAPIRQASSE